MTVAEKTPESEIVISQWLRERYEDFCKMLLDSLRNADYEEKAPSLKLLMQLMKEDAAHLTSNEEIPWRKGLFVKVLEALVTMDNRKQMQTDFMELFVEEYSDIKFSTLKGLIQISKDQNSPSKLDGIIPLLGMIKIKPNSSDKKKCCYFRPLIEKQGAQPSQKNLKQAGQEAWMAIIKQRLTKAQRKTLLELMVHHIAPWFARIELLMDFLTDSFNIGGSTALMALSGLFDLMQKRNLDYPQFYQKLYSLLDPHVLHSKHRSRFLRLLDTFLMSTHLPANLVASFLKRLARLCLYAPPSAVVVIIPWIYNLLKSHPICTFMIHRGMSSSDESTRLGLTAKQDPFSMEETDPALSHAIESSLWEIESLNTHFHPTVATIAKILSEQFTKQAYNLDDFLDHSYGSMLDAELTKEIMKTPAVDYEIPKRIFSDHEDIQVRSKRLVQRWGYS